MEKVRIPRKTGVRRNWILKGGVRGYSLRTSRSVNGDSTQVLERESGDSIEIIHLKGLIINQPGIVAAVGGIPDKLKLDGGISFWFPCPIFKVPNNLPRDPNARHKTLLEAYEKSSEKNAFKKGFIRAYKQAQGLREEENKEQLMEEQQHVTLVEVNLAAPLDPDGLYLNPESIPTHPIPIKQAPVESEFVKYGYNIFTYDAHVRGIIQTLRHNCGDHIEVTYLKGVVRLDPGFVAVAGGIPRDLRLNDGISFWCPCPTFKGPEILPQDPTERDKIMYDINMKAMEAIRKSFSEAHTKALLRLKQSKEEEHGMDMESCTMMEVNITHPEAMLYDLDSKPFELAWYSLRPDLGETFSK